MLQLRNTTPFAATLMLLPDPEGIDTIYVVVKGTFALGRGPVATLAVAEEQVPITLADEFHGDPGASSIKRPSDISLDKPGTDIVLLGSAWTPGGRPASYVDVWVAAGSVGKLVRVLGDRVWEGSAAGPVMTPPQPFQRLPLVWERAFGGVDVTEQGPVADGRNPAGVGFHTAKTTRVPEGTPVPNVEDPHAPITDWNQAPAPAGVAPVAAHWESRRRWAGTYDAAWQQRRAPYLPQDFDPRFFQLAAPGLSTPGHLQGGEGVDLRGVTPDGLLQFQLPAMRVDVSYRREHRTDDRAATLDTVILEPDEGRVELVWRASLRVDKDALKVREIRASLAS